MTEATLARAQAGDGEAFRELIQPYRGELQAHCYRILGSVQDAEDVLQEALLAAWRSLGRFDGRSLRSWLYRITTNRCLNYLRGESRRPQPAGLPYQGAGTTRPVPSGDPWWLEPYPDDLLGDVAPGPEARYDARESIALSFVAGLQHLPPQQRAVLVLRDVLGFPAAEAAVVERFVDALERLDLDRLVALLTDDARLAMPPEAVEVRGPLAIAAFHRELPYWGQDVKLVPTRANNQPAFAYYLADPCAPVWRASGLVVLTLRGNRVCGLTRFGAGGLLARFGLPRTLPRD